MIWSSRSPTVRFGAHNGPKSDIAQCPKSADFVAKVENRTTPKISRKLIFEPLCCCVAFQRHYGGPRSILDETIWSLTSPLVKRISGSKNFRWPPQKDFCNTIAGRADEGRAPLDFRFGPHGVDPQQNSRSGCLFFRTAHECSITTQCLRSPAGRIESWHRGAGSRSPTIGRRARR